MCEPKILFRHRVSQDVIFRDIDYFHHANNAAYSTWTESARMAYMRDVCGVTSLAEMAIILGELKIRFISPARFAETIEVLTRASRLGQKSFGLDHEIRGPEGRLLATVETTQVCYDHAAQRTIPIPEDWRQRMEKFEAEIDESACGQSL